MNAMIDCVREVQHTIGGPEAFAWAFVGVFAAHAAWDLTWAAGYGLLRGARWALRRIRSHLRHRRPTAGYRPVPRRAA